MFRRLMKKPSKYDITEHKDIKSEIRNAGSITLEATIFLTLFILFYMVLMDLVQIARAQIILQYSVNEVAKEVSTYGYLLTKTGIVEKRVATSGQANDFVGKTTEMVDAIVRVEETLTNGGDVIDAANDAGEKIQDYFGDTDQLVSSILSLIKTEGANIVSDYVIQEIVKGEIEEQIDMMSYKDADRYLQDLGIEDGLDGLDFSQTSWCNTSVGGMPVLEVVVVYTIDFNLGFIKLESRTFRVCAKTALW